VDIVFFLALFLVGVIFYWLESEYRNIVFGIIAGTLLIVTGWLVYPGLSYQRLDAINTTSNQSFSYSPGYFEFAFDNVSCHNCTNSTFNESFNATPPGCCAHNINTTISGEMRSQIDKAEAYSYSTQEVNGIAVNGLGLILVLVGLFTIYGLTLDERIDGTKGGGG
jgi:hypothetical protein